MDNLTQLLIDGLINQVTQLSERITALENDKRALAREIRTERVTVVDTAGKPRIHLSVMDGATAEVVVYHPTIDGAFASLVAGYDLETDDAAPAFVETCNGTGDGSQSTEMNSQGASLIHHTAGLRAAG